MGHLEQRGPGKWRVQVSLGTDPATGKPRRAARTFTARTKTEARKMAARIELELTGGPTASRATFGRLLDRYLEAAEVEPSTLYGYRSKVRTHIAPALGDVPVEDLTPARLWEFYRALGDAGLKPRTVAQIAAIVKGACRYGVLIGWLPANPARDVPRPKIRRGQVPLPELDAVSRLFSAVSAADPEFATMLWVAAVTGVRRGELLGLRWGDLEAGTVTVGRVIDQWRNVKEYPKRGEPRRVYLDAVTLELLDAHHGRQAAAWDETPEAWWFVFPSPEGPGVPRNPDAVTRRLAWFRRRLEIDAAVTLKSLRHLAASVLVGGGTDAKTAAARLGHDPAMLLGTYAHPLSEPERAAAELAGRAVAELLSPTGRVAPVGDGSE